MEGRRLRVGFLHPDLGIGGAERLVVDAAVGLQSKGHEIVMFTSHHDPTHCFPETRDGTLNVNVFGDFLPRSIAGRFMIVFAFLRSIWLAISVLWLYWFASVKFDVFIVDQISLPIPLLKLTRAKILFYCHYPDKLLSKHDTLLKRIYRMPADYIEDLTTGMADSILVNSKFTAGVFKRSFPTIRKDPEILYPSIDLRQMENLRVALQARKNDTYLESVRKLLRKNVLLSINRFERKKEILLAIRALAKIRHQIGRAEFADLQLVIAGGYDPRVIENVEHHAELVKECKSNGLSYMTYTDSLAIKSSLSLESQDRESTSIEPVPTVLFLPSLPELAKEFLLSRCLCLLYTPPNEHFGIVPIEAMAHAVPVVACNSGGPTESLLQAVTGFLVETSADGFAEGTLKIMAMSVAERAKMGEQGRSRVHELFGLEAFTKRLNQALMRMVNHQHPSSTSSSTLQQQQQQQQQQQEEEASHDGKKRD